MRSTVLSGIGCFARPSNGVHILNGHFATKNNSGSSTPFRRTLDYLSRYCTLVDFETAVDYVVSGRATVLDKPYIAFTFDDGVAECSQVIAPTLEEFGVNACFFINPGFIDGNTSYRTEFTARRTFMPGRQPMGWDEVLDLHGRGFVIGNHTRDHFRLSELTAEDVTYQIQSGKQAIESQTGSPCLFFAWPFGKYSDVTETAISVATKYHSYIFSSDKSCRYGDLDRGVLNRRHFEPFWPTTHVACFLSMRRRYSVAQ